MCKYNYSDLLLHWCKVYVTSGFSLVPCIGKRPLKPWKEAQKRQQRLEDIEDILKKHDYKINLGVVPLSEFVIVDIDSIDKFVKESSLPWDVHTLVEFTARGVHLLFRTNNKTSEIKKLSWGEIRGRNGYTVVTPSITDGFRRFWTYTSIENAIRVFTDRDFGSVKRLTPEEWEMYLEDLPLIENFLPPDDPPKRSAPVKELGKEQTRNRKDITEVRGILFDLLKNFYNRGYRHLMILYLAGGLRKAGFSEVEATEILKAFYENDEERKDRVIAIKTTYEKPLEEVAFSRIFEDVLLPQIQNEVDALKVYERIKKALELTVENEHSFEILGYRQISPSEIYFYLWDRQHQRVREISSNAGNGVWATLTQNTNKKILGALKESIYILASERGEIQGKRGIGIWGDGEKIIINTGKELVIYDGELHIQRTPVLSRYLYTFNNEWVDGEKLLSTKSSLEEVFEEVRTKVSQWRFKHEEMIDDLTCLVLLAPFQTLMYWRPWVYLKGARGTGKTTFFVEVLERLYRPLTIRVDKTTAYGLVQALSGTGKIALIDEFEPDRRTREVLEVLKLTNERQGGVVLRGTTSAHHLELKIHHLPFLASIKTSFLDTAQLTRTIIFELVSHRNKRLNMFTPEEAWELRHKIIRTLLENWWEIDSVANEIRANKNEYDFEGRDIDNFAYILALKGKLMGQIHLPDYLTERERDEERLLEDILDSVVEVERGEKILVADALKNYEMYSKQLATAGIGLTEHKEKEGLFIVPSRVARRLLRDINIYDADSIKSLLLYFEGSEFIQARLKGDRVRGVFIPLESLKSFFEDIE